MDSFISWIGGKKLLRKEICASFPQDEFDRYIEVFGGAGWVLFYKDKHAKLEVYNDINNSLVNLFKSIKYHPNAVYEELEYLLNSRKTFNEFKSLYQNTALTEIQRAAIYFYMIKYSYSSNVRCFAAMSRCFLDDDVFNKVKKRLKKVVIENKDYESLIKQYDRPSALFYCDPPYYGSEKQYKDGGDGFNLNHHKNLRDILKYIKGRCVISYNNDTFIYDLYKGFNIREVERKSKLTGRYGNKNPYKELIITNF